MRVGVRGMLLTAGLLAGALSVGAGQAPGTPPAATRYADPGQLMQDVEALAAPDMQGRATGTPGGLRARQWILARFQAIGLAPLGPAGHTQPFAIAARDLRGAARSRRGPVEGANIVGRITGQEPAAAAIVVTAHYDHLGVRDGRVYPGADDNASGVAVLLAAARHFAGRPMRRTLIFGALDGEELGHHGARALVRSLAPARGTVALNINLDMMSRSATREIYAAGAYHSPWLAPILGELGRRSSIALRLGHDRPARSREDPEDWTHQSDHGPFHDAQVPFVYFGVEDHPDYHQPTDTAGRIDPAFLAATAELAIDAIQTFDRHLK